ncbi:molybdopterin-dependent oxidoreductase [Microbacterium esteraromaticum]|uniref:Molybdopterin-dependent oxidoreductase n=1 Tax=Microbacterium esteraromaticum TaxID=57043 RepID=A0A7D8AHW3_9MICO|nr:molybdopterin-dependent oxidoreductase [Microbacterium esteraromaticum]QMU96385.1 molybdopterin-dependent oxidoreductase [Microbacterium esteraromaticum]
MEGSLRRRGVAAAAGIAAAVLGAGAGELLAALFAPSASPFAVVGGALIDAAPTWAKDTAIAWFGTADKAALLVGISIVLLALAAVAGIVEVRRPRAGVIALAVVGVAVGVLALTRADAGSPAWLPSAVAGATAATALRMLVRSAPFARAASAPANGAAAATAQAPDPQTPPARTRPANTERPTAENAPTTASGSATASGHDRANAPTTASGSATASASAPVSASSPSRRTFLAWAGGTTLVGIALAAAGALTKAGSAAVTVARDALRLPGAASPAPAMPPGAQFDVAGLPPLITPNRDFYRIDTALIMPTVDPAEWRLRIHGMVEKEVTLTWDELLSLPLTERAVTLSCVSNPVGGDLVGNAVWLGYPIRELLARAVPHADADMVLSTSADGFTAGTPLEALTDDRDALLTIGMNGEPLPLAHGFPVRMVVPGLYGYVSATKWVTELEVTRFDRARAYWTDRGWSAKGPIKLQSRIDVPRARSGLDAGDSVIAGVAWQPGTGISGVEVQVDDGPWERAELASALSDDTWVQWRLPWRAQSGDHRIRCRALGADGAAQTDAIAPPAPEGATGWHTISVTVT